MGLFILVGRLTGAGKEVAVAWRYGVSEKVDVYVFIMSLIGLPAGVWFSVITMVLLPLIAREKNINSIQLSIFRRELLGVTLVAGSLAGLFVYVAIWLALENQLLKFSDYGFEYAKDMIGPMSALIPVGFLISLFSSWMMAANQHRSTLLEAVPALVILISLLLPDDIIPNPLVWGTVSGFVAHLMILRGGLSLKGRMSVPLFSVSSNLWRGFWANFKIVAVGQVLMSAANVLDQIFAANVGAGANSSLGYASRVIGLIISMGALAISRSMLPVFSELLHRENENQVKLIARHWMKWMFLFGLVVVAVVWWMAPYLIEILFERGEFGSSDTIVVAKIMRILLLQIPFYFSAIVFHVYFSSCGKYKEITKVSIICVLAKIMALTLFVGFNSVYAIAFSTVIMLATYWILFAAMDLK